VYHLVFNKTTKALSVWREHKECSQMILVALLTNRSPTDKDYGYMSPFRSDTFWIIFGELYSTESLDEIMVEASLMAL